MRNEELAKNYYPLLRIPRLEKFGCYLTCLSVTDCGDCSYRFNLRRQKGCRPSSTELMYLNLFGSLGTAVVAVNWCSAHDLGVPFITILSVLIATPLLLSGCLYD